jgi:hypothetical protein
MRAYRTARSPATTRVVGKAAILPALLWLALGSTGCVHTDTTPVEVDSEPSVPPPPTVTRDVVIGADDTGEVPPESAPAVLVWSAVKVRQAEPVLFRLGAGLGALGHIDLEPCREEGLSPGYVHMHLTFAHTGHVVKAAVETPVAPPAEALACIGEQVEATLVPGFDGGNVMLSKSFYVN